MKQTELCYYCWVEVTKEEHEEVQILQDTDNMWHLWLLKKFGVASHVVDYVDSCKFLHIHKNCWLSEDREKRHQTLEPLLLAAMDFPSL